MYALLLALAILLLTSCTGDPAADALHHTADSLIAVGRPDSALQLLNTLPPDLTGAESPCQPQSARSIQSPASLSRRQRMRHELLRARAMNKAYIDFTTDSVMKLVADYYDRHGTPNERMEAHYLLGCTYRDMGEAPHAIDCYLDAAACADTTATDCDFYKLASIYAQMAKLYHKQLLLSYEIKAHRKASHYDYLAGDTLHGLFEQKMIAGIFIVQNKRDSAEAVLLHTIKQYYEHGFQQDALLSSILLMHLYSEQPSRIPDLKILIDTFDNKNTMFDENHELPPNQRLFFCYKARFFEETNQLDSAEFYYRKMQHRNMLPTSQNSMYKGLLSVFGKRGQADSITKYSQLYCKANDSSIAIKDQELTAQLSASYKYNCIQKESIINAEKAHKANVRLFLTLSLLLATAIITAFLVCHFKRQRRKQQAEYIATIAERAKLQEELDYLHAKDYDAVIARKEEEIEKLSKTIVSHETAYRSVMSKDKLSLFEESTIVKLFSDKSNFRKGVSEISNDEWEELVMEFRQDMPSAYSLLKNLSTLQLHVCILLLLDYEESVIAVLKNTKPQVINNAKLRANKKLCQKGDSASLKSNLKRLIVA
jgi:hypothetical protein